MADKPYAKFRVRLFVLRHEKRTHDPTFFSGLTPQGRHGANILGNQLKDCHPHVIFCSPFRRTLQTIAPLAAKSGLRIRPEYGLYELTHDRKHTMLYNIDDYCEWARRQPFGEGESTEPEFPLPPIMQLLDLEACSHYPHSQLTLGEGSKELTTRVRHFLTSLLASVENGTASWLPHPSELAASAQPEIRVVISTHMHPVNVILSRWFKRDLNAYFPSGGVAEILLSPGQKAQLVGMPSEEEG